jgi:hypothetical protein
MNCTRERLFGIDRQRTGGRNGGESDHYLRGHSAFYVTARAGQGCAVVYKPPAVM